MGKYETRFVDSEDKVPDGYARLVSMGDRAAQKSLSDAQMAGHIRAYKIVRTASEIKSGAVWVHKGDAETWLANRGMRGGLPGLSLATAAQPEILCVLERIATALEAMATKP